MVKDMTQGNPVKLLLSFAVPMLIGNIFQQFYNMVDAIVVGQAIGVEALAAVGLTGSMSFLVLGFVTGLTGGFAVIVAQRFGASDADGLRHAVAMSTLLCVAMTVVSTIVAMLTAKPLLEVMQTPADAFDGAFSYIMIIYGGIGATVFYNMISGVLRALGDSKTPLYFLIISSIVNVILDLLFVMVFHMGVGGAAWATVISQALSGFLCLLYTAKRFPILRFQKKDWQFSGHTCLLLMRVGLPMALQFSITAIGCIVLQGAVNSFGTAVIGAYTAACKVEQLTTQPMVTMGATMATYAGQNLGANKFDRVRDGVRKCTLITVGFSLLGSAIVLLFGDPLVRMFISADQQTPAVMQSAAQYLNTIALFYIPLGLLYVFRNALQGLGSAFIPMFGGLMELIMRVVAALILSAIATIGFVGICIASPIAWIGAVVPLLIAYPIITRKLENQIKNYQAMKQSELITSAVE